MVSPFGPSGCACIFAPTDSTPIAITLTIVLVQPLKWPVKCRTTQPYPLSALGRLPKSAGYRIHWQDHGHKSSWFSSIKPHSKTRQWYAPRITCPKHKRLWLSYYYQAQQHKNNWSLRSPPLWMTKSEITVVQCLYPTKRFAPIMALLGRQNTWPQQIQPNPYFRSLRMGVLKCIFIQPQLNFSGRGSGIRHSTLVMSDS